MKNVDINIVFELLPGEELDKGNFWQIEDEFANHGIALQRVPTSPCNDVFFRAIGAGTMDIPELCSKLLPLLVVSKQPVTLSISNGDEVRNYAHSSIQLRGAMLRLVKSSYGESQSTFTDCTFKKVKGEWGFGKTPNGLVIAPNGEDVASFTYDIRDIHLIHLFKLVVEKLRSDMEIKISAI